MFWGKWSASAGRRSRLFRRTTLGLLALASRPVVASAQTAPPAVAGASVAVGGEVDSYLRYMESLGRTPLVPWGIRPFAPSVVDSLTAIRGAHPWARSWLFAPSAASNHVRMLPVELTARYNSAYPYGLNEGPVWAGRGLTSSLQAGVAVRAGPVSLVLDPVVFRAENQPFSLRPTGVAGLGQFADPLWPQRIDRPQRFGSAPYTHVDPGESTLRLDLLGASLGVTSANEWWGPASMFPIVVGNNAAGVPRAFLGTERPVNIWLGLLQARVEYGLEMQSAFSPVVGPSTYTSPDSSGTVRLMSGLVVTFSPAIFTGLEIGAGRYFHEAWMGHFDADVWKTPFQGLLKSSIPRGIAVPGADDRDALKNQLASVFFRWVLPHGGIDVYGEYGREDYAENQRALEVQPDLSRIYGLGFRKAFAHRDSAAFDALRAEVFDSDPTTMGLYRPEGRTYVHYPIRQGHTEEGKVIGSPAGIGAPAGAVLAWDRYARSGRTSAYVLKTSENTPSDFPSAPQTTVTAGVSTMRFNRFGSATLDVATVRTNRLSVGWGGWNLSASAGLVVSVP